MSNVNRTAAPANAAPPAVLRFSQISNLLKCPVVGICLTLDEQRSLVRKAGVCVAKMDDFEIHEILVNTCDENTLLARQAHALLRKKYELKVAPLRRLDQLSFVKHWDAAFASGKYVPELWAAATRPDLPLAVQHHIFGCAHMDMHEALGDKFKHQDQLRHAQQERAALVEKLRIAKAGLAQAQKERQELSRQHEALLRHKDALHAENQRLHAQLDAQSETLRNAVRSTAPEANPAAGCELGSETAHAAAPETAHATASTADLHAQVECLEHSLLEALARAEAAEQGYIEAVEERETQAALVQALQQELRSLLVPQSCASCTQSCAACTEACATCAEPCAACTEACDLCPRRILMVGGMTRLASLYRDVVEAKGHQFEYHDGYLGGVNTLETSLQKADIVLCPVSCNSHRACLLVKNLCKKYKKTVHMMPNYSLSAVAQVLARNENSPAQ